MFPSFFFKIFFSFRAVDDDWQKMRKARRSVRDVNRIKKKTDTDDDVDDDDEVEIEYF